MWFDYDQPCQQSGVPHQKHKLGTIHRQHYCLRSGMYTGGARIWCKQRQFAKEVTDSVLKLKIVARLGRNRCATLQYVPMNTTSTLISTGPTTFKSTKKTKEYYMVSPGFPSEIIASPPTNFSSTKCSAIATISRSFRAANRGTCFRNAWYSLN